MMMIVQDSMALDYPEKKALLLQLMNHAKNQNIHLQESDIIGVFEYNEDAPTINKLSNGEIINNALNMFDCSNEEGETTDSE